MMGINPYTPIMDDSILSFTNLNLAAIWGFPWISL